MSSPFKDLIIFLDGARERRNRERGRRMGEKEKTEGGEERERKEKREGKGGRYSESLNEP